MRDAEGTVRPRLLDLFCREGGAAKGYSEAGFEVVGVDTVLVTNYAGDRFVQADALDVLRLLVGDENDRHEAICVLGLEGGGNGEGFLAADDGGLLGTVDAHHVGHVDHSAKPASRVKWFDAIHASPPCQAYTAMQSVAKNSAAHERLIPVVRAHFRRLGLPYVIENVEGAKSELETPVALCGTSFGLGAKTHIGYLELRRHRFFETNWPILVPGCQHRGRTIGIYGDHARSDRRHGAQSQFTASDGLRYAREAMEMPWATWDGLREAIPPAYTRFIGAELLRQLFGLELAA